MAEKKLDTRYEIRDTKAVPKRILITRTDRLGDVVLSTPIIKHMRKLFPEAHIAFMVRPENKDVVLNNPDLDEVILYDKRGHQKSFIETVKFAGELRKKNFDTAIALHPTNRVHMMFFLAGIPNRIGYDRKMTFLLTKKVKHVKQIGDKHEIDYNFDLLAKSGFDIKDAQKKPYIVTADTEKRLVDSVLRDLKVGGDMIAIHPGASCASKRWPPERFAFVANELAEKYGCDIVVIGGDETQSFSDAMTSKMKVKFADLTGTFLIGELAEVLSRCRLFISNDSGPVHVAVAVNTPVISIFGRKSPGLSPKRWGPVGEKDVFLHKPPECDKCLAHDCLKEFQCLIAVTVRDVIEAAGKILD